MVGDGLAINDDAIFCLNWVLTWLLTEFCPYAMR